jgi:hypothetical protein
MLIKYFGQSIMKFPKLLSNSKIFIGIEYFSRSVMKFKGTFIQEQDF